MKWLIITLKIVVSVGLLAYLVSTVKVDSLIGVLRSADRSYLLLAIGIMILQIAIITERLRIVLRSVDHPIRYATAARVTWEGVFSNQVLPGAVGGDAVRVFRCFQSGLSLSEATGAIVADRLFGLFALLAIALVVLFVVPLPASVDSWRPALAVTLVLFGAAAVAIYGDRLTPWLPMWKPFQWARSVAGHLRRVVSTGEGAVQAFALSLLSQTLALVSIYFIATGLDPAFDPRVVIVSVPWALLLTSIPVSIAGWGIRETSFVALFGLFGISQELAFAISILFGFLSLLASLPGGVLLMLPSKETASHQTAANS